MAIIDQNFLFAAAQAVSTTSDVVSTNVFDAVTAKKLFGGSLGSFPAKVIFTIQMTGGTGTLSYRARFVGADDAALTTNAVILEDTGVQLKGPDGATALANTDFAAGEFHLSMQAPAKRYYGVIFTLGGTSPTATANAFIALDSQTNQANPKAAVP